MESAIAEIERGGRVESRHAGTAVVVDAAGKVVFSLGDIDRPTYPRSAVKAFLALPLVESGAAGRLGLEDEELALACASHTGEAAHVAVAARMLARTGHDAACLECGTHWPVDADAAHALARAGGAPSALHNNCSGKHAGFVCLACDQDQKLGGYIHPDHPVMREVTAALADVTGAAHGPDNMGIDGCSIPTYAIPLRALAHGFARFGTGHGLGPERARAAARLRAAVAAAPFMVGGTGRFDSVLMQEMGPAVFSKMGAEGIMAASLPDQGLGIAVKCHDGAPRAAEVAMAALLMRFLGPDARDNPVLRGLAQHDLRNWNGMTVGRVRAAGPMHPDHRP
ncbi:asparaginase [Gluconacetobacter diazotrophicus]|uniref:Putative L-asparaginase II protein n=1 Tax=Gluconacetobacter diazotrophicus (strain ATCC 49037 / DSM 5601 / CCUG 37298 / CIP 103539 / LMG 7603 / PAl5) TaxID=272568 RepID=A9HE73_GLUDA|nr:asparaginase [Gluconacetobacter diazotrophicus]CAP55193.1 putative L-asparaginase II protein [Gluconacetobacter diazotrophicus PA1 5]